MVSARRVSSGAKKQSKRTNKVPLKNLVGYLKSDCYMFAPLFSASPPPSPSCSVAGSQTGCEFEKSGYGAMELNKGKKRTMMLETVVEYLKSDYHLYGSMTMISPPLKGQVTSEKRATIEISKSTTTISQRTLRSSNVKRNEQCPGTSSCRHPRTAKHDKALSLRRSLRQRSHTSSSQEGAKRKPNKRRIGIE